MEIKAYSKFDLSQLYGISLKVLRRWLNEIEKGFTGRKKVLSPKEVERFVSFHGQPKRENN